MTILQALDGKFYDVPDDELGRYEVPRERVKALLEQSGNLPAAQGRRSPAGGPPSGGPVVIQAFPQGQKGPNGHAPAGHPGGGEVDPYWHWWRNVWWRTLWWRNYWWSSVRR